MTDYAQRLSTPESYAAYGGPYGSGTVDGSEFQDAAAYDDAVRASPTPHSPAHPVTWGSPRRQHALAPCFAV